MFLAHMMTSGKGGHAGMRPPNPPNVMRVYYYTQDQLEDPDLCGFTMAGWYFWDETLTQLQGPFVSEAEAVDACADFYKELEDWSIKS